MIFYRNAIIVTIIYFVIIVYFVINISIFNKLINKLKIIIILVGIILFKKLKEFLFTICKLLVLLILLVLQILLILLILTN